MLFNKQDWIEKAKKQIENGILSEEEYQYALTSWVNDMDGKEIESPTAEDIPPEHVEVDRKQQILYEIDQLKAQLQATDYQAIKYAEGWITEEDYREIKYKRQELRNKINELENEFNAFNI